MHRGDWKGVIVGESRVENDTVNLSGAGDACGAASGVGDAASGAGGACGAAGDAASGAGDACGAGERRG